MLLSKSAEENHNVYASALFRQYAVLAGALRSTPQTCMCQHQPQQQLLDAAQHNCCNRPWSAQQLEQVGFPQLQ